MHIYWSDIQAKTMGKACLSAILTGLRDSYKAGWQGRLYLCSHGQKLPRKGHAYPYCEVDPQDPSEESFCSHMWQHVLPLRASYVSTIPIRALQGWGLLMTVNSSSGQPCILLCHSELTPTLTIISLNLFIILPHLSIYTIVCLFKCIFICLPLVDLCSVQLSYILRFLVSCGWHWSLTILSCIFCTYTLVINLEQQENKTNNK